MKDNVEPHSSLYLYSRRNLYFAAFLAAYLFSTAGSIIGWSSPALILLEDRNFTSDVNTMLVSLPGLAPGPLITMFGLDLIGRKYCLGLTSFTAVLCYVIMLLTHEVTALLIARFISGWGMGAAFSTIGIYISEISDVGSRAALNSSAGVFIALGLIIVQAVGPFITFDMLNVLCLALPGAFALLFWFLPESPYYLVKKGDMEKARASLVWLRLDATDKNIDNELAQIQNSIEEERKQTVGVRKLFTSRAVFKQFGIAWFLLFMQQAAGLLPITGFAQTIFIQANLPINAAFVPTLINIIALVASFTSPFFVKTFGNRFCILVATVICGLAHSVTGVYFHLQELGIDMFSYSWAPVVSVCVIVSTIHMGLSVLVWSVVADLFAPSVKGYANGICGIYSTLLGFASSTIFGTCKDKFGYGPTFLGFGATMLVSSIGVYFIPNVSSMTLQEIQDHFEGKNKKKEMDDITVSRTTLTSIL